MAKDTGKTRRQRRRTLFSPLNFIIICLAILMGMSVFFRVSYIEVRGNSLYTAEEVIAASGITEGDNLFFFNRLSSMSRIITRLPYIDTAVVSRGLPNRLIIEIRESVAVASIDLEGKVWIIDASCKLLGTWDSYSEAGFIKISGLTPVNPISGQHLETEAADAAKIPYLSELLTRLSARGMAANITELDMTNLVSPTFRYLGRFTVKVGRNENLDYKLGTLLSSIELLPPSDTGTLDLSIDDQVHFVRD